MAQRRKKQRLNINGEFIIMENKPGLPNMAQRRKKQRLNNNVTKILKKHVYVPISSTKPKLTSNLNLLKKMKKELLKMQSSAQKIQLYEQELVTNSKSGIVGDQAYDQVLESGLKDMQQISSISDTLADQTYPILIGVTHEYRLRKMGLPRKTQNAVKTPNPDVDSKC